MQSMHTNESCTHCAEEVLQLHELQMPIWSGSLPLGKRQAHAFIILVAKSDGLWSIQSKDKTRRDSFG
jgi:hypothetical protein